MHEIMLYYDVFPLLRETEMRNSMTVQDFIFYVENEHISMLSSANCLESLSVLIKSSPSSPHWSLSLD